MLTLHAREGLTLVNIQRPHGSNEQRANKEKCYEMLRFIHLLNRPRADGLKAIFREKAYFFVP